MCLKKACLLLSGTSCRAYRVEALCLIFVAVSLRVSQILAAVHISFTLCHHEAWSHEFFVKGNRYGLSGLINSFQRVQQAFQLLAHSHERLILAQIFFLFQTDMPVYSVTANLFKGVTYFTHTF